MKQFETVDFEFQTNLKFNEQSLSDNVKPMTISIMLALIQFDKIQNDSNLQCNCSALHMSVSYIHKYL